MGCRFLAFALFNMCYPKKIKKEKKDNFHWCHQQLCFSPPGHINASAGFLLSQPPAFQSPPLERAHNSRWGRSWHPPRILAPFVAAQFQLRVLADAQEDTRTWMLPWLWVYPPAGTVIAQGLPERRVCPRIARYKAGALFHGAIQLSLKEFCPQLSSQGSS